MSSGLGKWRKQTLAGVFVTPVILSVVQQSSTVSADESMTWWLTKNVLRLAGTVVATLMVKKVAKKVFGLTNKSEAKVKNSEKAKSNSNGRKVVQPVILLVNKNTKGKEHVAFVNKKMNLKKAEKTKTKNKLNYNEPSKKVTNAMELFRNVKKKRNENEKKPLYKGFLMKGKFFEIVAEELNKKSPNLANLEIVYYKKIIEDFKNIREEFGDMKKYREALKKQKNNVPLLCSDLFFVVNKDGSFEAFYYDAKDNKKVLFLDKNSPIQKLIKTEFGNMKKMKKDENVYSVEKGIIISKVKENDEKEAEEELKKLSNDLNEKGKTVIEKSEKDLEKELEDLEENMNKEEEMKQEKLNEEISAEYEDLSKEVYKEKMEELSKKEEKIDDNIDYADKLLEETENNLIKEEKGFDAAIENFSKDFEILNN